MVDYNKVVLVDEQDNVLGEMDKMEAHSNGGVRHRAVTVVLFRKTESGLETLLQKRGTKKPLWPLFWDGATSTHPVLHERYEDCGSRRLSEEMGISLAADKLEMIQKQVYREDYKDGLAECEVNGILVGWYSGEVVINPEEVADCKWVLWDWAKKDAVENRNNYAPWWWMLLEDGSVDMWLSGGK